MLHIFLSNWPDDVRYGTTGKPLPGYQLKIIGDNEQEVGHGEIGDLWVDGATAACGYWNNRAASRATFLGPWTRTGDKYYEDEDGYYVYCGRSDDMMKVNGMFVSPAEVEAALIAHGDVLEAAVVGAADADGLIKPKAFVVAKPGVTASQALAQALEEHAKDCLPSFKRPRWIALSRNCQKLQPAKSSASSCARQISLALSGADLRYPNLGDAAANSAPLAPLPTRWRRSPRPSAALPDAELVR